jgi:hypothetical protein
MAVTRFAIRGCVVLVIGLVARDVGVKHGVPMPMPMPMPMRRVVRGMLLRWVKMRIGRRDEADEQA